MDHQVIATVAQGQLQLRAYSERYTDIDSTLGGEAENSSAVYERWRSKAITVRPSLQNRALYNSSISVLVNVLVEILEQDLISYDSLKAGLAPDSAIGVSRATSDALCSLFTETEQAIQQQIRLLEILTSAPSAPEREADSQSERPSRVTMQQSEDHDFGKAEAFVRTVLQSMRSQRNESGVSDEVVSDKMMVDRLAAGVRTRGIWRPPRADRDSILGLFGGSLKAIDFIRQSVHDDEDTEDENDHNRNDEDDEEGEEGEEKSGSPSNKKDIVGKLSLPQRTTDVAKFLKKLRPYNCTYAGCESPFQLFKTADDWIQHESTAHRYKWVCPLEKEMQFTSRIDLGNHVQEHHSDIFGSEELNAIMDYVRIPGEEDRTNCLFCYQQEESTSLDAHIAMHFDALAVLSLYQDQLQATHANEPGIKTPTMSNTHDPADPNPPEFTSTLLPGSIRAGSWYKYGRIFKMPHMTSEGVVSAEGRSVWYITVREAQGYSLCLELKTLLGKGAGHPRANPGGLSIVYDGYPAPPEPVEAGNSIWHFLGPPIRVMRKNFASKLDDALCICWDKVHRVEHTLDIHRTVSYFGKVHPYSAMRLREQADKAVTDWYELHPDSPAPGLGVMAFARSDRPEGHHASESESTGTGSP